MRRLSIVAAIAVLVSMLGQPAQAVGALPSVPREVSIAARAANELTLAWLAPASEGLTPIESYNVYFKPTLDPLWVLSQNVLSPTTSAVVTGLQSGVTYQFRVTAVNA
ncbi:MAG: bent, isoform, partial [Actinomycetota bacterium]